MGPPPNFFPLLHLFLVPFFELHIYSMPKRKRYPTPISSSDPAEKHEHSIPTRRAVQALDQAGHGRAEIESITHVQPRTQTRILQSNTYHRPGRERGGRPCLLDQDTVEKMIKSLQGH